MPQSTSARGPSAARLTARAERPAGSFCRASGREGRGRGSLAVDRSAFLRVTEKVPTCVTVSLCHKLAVDDTGWMPHGGSGRQALSRWSRPTSTADSVCAVNSRAAAIVGRRCSTTIGSPMRTSTGRRGASCPRVHEPHGRGRRWRGARSRRPPVPVRLVNTPTAAPRRPVEVRIGEPIVVEQRRPTIAAARELTARSESAVKEL